MGGCLSSCFVAKGAGFNLGENYLPLAKVTQYMRGRQSTSQPVNSPLLELLERDLSRGGDFIEA